MKSPMSLWQDVAQDLGDMSSVSTNRDCKTVADRTKSEGFGFLSIALASFGKDFDEALDKGQVSPSHFAGFSRCGELPRFLGGFLEKVFVRSSGVLRDDADIACVRAVRQLTRMFSKVNLPCSQERERKAFESYVKIDSQLDVEMPDESLDRDYFRISRLVFGHVLSRMDSLCATPQDNLWPKHGPGTTADMLLGNEKYGQSVWHRRLEEGGFNSVDLLLPNARHWQSTYYQAIEFREPECEEPVRVIAVPKTQSNPRIIAAEPTCMQYAQQALKDPLVFELEHDRVVGNLLGFTDQEPNRKMARLGSYTGELATIDLSEASDRVSLPLVERLLKGYTNFSEMVFACRSTRADVGDLGVITLKKFASMGSALCFPIEAMVFLTLTLVGIERARGIRFREADILALHGSVRVYGDDIIVPQKYAESVSRVLEASGLKVNRHKSFWNGNFRESCGKDYFRGFDVTYVKVRRMMPSNRQDAEEIASAVSLRNQLFDAGFDRAVANLDRELLRLLGGRFPFVEATSPLLGRHTNGYLSPEGLDDQHRPYAKGFMLVPKIPENSLDDIGALLKFFLKKDGPPSEEGHLERSGRPQAVRLLPVNGPIR